MAEKVLVQINFEKNSQKFLPNFRKISFFDILQNSLKMFLRKYLETSNLWRELFIMAYRENVSFAEKFHSRRCVIMLTKMAAALGNFTLTVGQKWLYYEATESLKKQVGAPGCKESSLTTVNKFWTKIFVLITDSYGSRKNFCGKFFFQKN